MSGVTIISARPQHFLVINFNKSQVSKHRHLMPLHSNINGCLQSRQHSQRESDSSDHILLQKPHIQIRSSSWLFIVRPWSSGDTSGFWIFADEEDWLWAVDFDDVGFADIDRVGCGRDFFLVWKKKVLACCICKLDIWIVAVHRQRPNPLAWNFSITWFDVQNRVSDCQMKSHLKMLSCKLFQWYQHTIYRCN